MRYIERLLQRVIDEAVNENQDFCILLESKKDTNHWVQLTFDSINVAYPYDEDPLIKLLEREVPLFPDFGLADWQPSLFGTFDHQAEPLEQIAAFVADYFQKVLGTSAAETDMRIEEQQL